MKCLYCVNYNDKEKKCDNGHSMNNCLFFKDISRCQSNCDNCKDRYICDIHNSDIKDKQGYIDYYMRNSEV